MSKCYDEYVKINDIKQYFLHYPDNSGCVVLFLHGGPGQSEAQLAYKTILKDRACSVVYYDQRGTGKTQSKNKSKPDTITMDRLLSDLKETVRYIRNKYPNKKLILLGHSWGSVLGMEYIKEHSDTVDAYVGMGQVVSFKCGEKVAYERCYKWATEKDKKRLESIGDYPDCITKENINEKCPKFRKIQAKYNLTGYSGGNMQLVKIFMNSPIFSVADIIQQIKAQKSNVNLLELLAEYDISDRTEFSIPVYFICGENDWQVPSVVVKKFFKTIDAPDKELFWVRDAGHLTDLDNPVEYNKVLKSICERIANYEK